MRRATNIGVAFLAGTVVAALVLAELGSFEPRTKQSSSSPGAPGITGQLRLQSVGAGELEKIDVIHAPAPQTAHDERVQVETGVRSSPMMETPSQATHLLSEWESSQRSEGMLAVEGAALLASQLCYTKACILTFLYPNQESYLEFDRRQADEGGLVDIWPGSKFSSGLDAIQNRFESSWVLYFDDPDAWVDDLAN